MSERPEDANTTSAPPQAEFDAWDWLTAETPAADAGGRVPLGRDPTASRSEALSVTRLAPFSEPAEWRVLACGVDTLDVGIQVDWGATWEFQSAQLDRSKELASGTNGILSGDGKFSILPGGKGQNYRWHLQWPEFHLFIAKGQEPQGNTPNVFASINARTLWEQSVPVAVAQVQAEIEALGGKVLQIKPSRCDLAADFLLPAGLTLEFLLAQRVPSHVKHLHIMAGERLETFYQGATSSPIRLRIYHKSLEVLQDGTKPWFYDVWGVGVAADVWRVEFQLRRAFLKETGINDLEALQQRLGGLWSYLTESWFSLRQPENRNATRRAVHPFWQAVQQCAPQFGPAWDCRRNPSAKLANSDWYVSHTAGCLISFAVRERLPEFEQAAERIVQRMREHLRSRNFARMYELKSIQLGVPGQKCEVPGDQPTDETEVRP